MKKEIFYLIFIGIGVVLGAAGYWYFFGEKTQKITSHTEEHFQVLTPQIQRDTILIVKTKLKTKTDTIKIYSFDSLTSYINWLSIPVDTSIRFDTVAKVDIQYNPVDHQLGIGFLLSEMKKDSIVIYDTTTIERQKTLSDYAFEISGIFILYELIKIITSLL